MIRLSFIFLAACASPFTRGWVDQETRALSGFSIGEEAPSLPPRVDLAQPIGVDGAVEVALWNSTRFRAELARLGFSRADLLDAGTLPNPVLSFLFPILTRQFEASVSYPFGALLQMPFRVAAAKRDVERTARTMVEVALDLERDVRVACAEVSAADERLAIRAELQQAWARIAALMAVRQAAGDASELERRVAASEAFAATDAHARAQQDLAIARTRLRRLLGLGNDPLGVTLRIARASPPAASPPLATLEARAIAVRPDVRAADMAVEAAAARLHWERAKILQLLARIDAKPIGSAGGAPNVYPPGFQLELPLLGWNQGGRARADVEIAQATMRSIAVREDIVTDVRVAHAQLSQALMSLAPWREQLLPMLDANVKAALVAYESGNETYLVVLDAVRRSQEAKLRAADLEADARRAEALLERAVGSKVRT